MSSAPFDIDLAIQRLAGELGKALQQVRGAADYASITDFQSFRPPEAFALLVNERAASGQAAGSTGSASTAKARQPAIVEFGVVLAVQNARYQRGAPAVRDAMPLIGKVRDALIGWQPPGLSLARPVMWRSGRVIGYDAGVLLWGDVFTTQHSIGSKP
ncbi:MAG: hypothetical protein CGU28_03130 [Candidatus Dactylopiibacterium carminicum]|uniref:Virion structural protein n=1 Tax=Candidatus Dactylopiibacterium carminicum TaxID=857335 RepID=A0A272EYG1_9RHOO|nr:hypothetical protein [Candidatus Dactylopiibacterium carminicum]KAF7600622.1 hypothetical protein BGI27_01695 [Candidatus Dactylopiibacterium carminicum]PAS95143.1 MAG: hypothetical protein CGU29_01475 [Candidatus Dactylopiibacterium carminicum]PAS97947.1 MAG: hypothetical protein CGU28_03130 [Candidatus Dactylopiibacterium carminicum]PAT00620.1 MAG: hypothetical protein BSR46_01705 [Candidatus Dactylopiibacterium carminicum]